MSVQDQEEKEKKGGKGGRGKEAHPIRLQIRGKQTLFATSCRWEERKEGRESDLLSLRAGQEKSVLRWGKQEKERARLGKNPFFL